MKAIIYDRYGSPDALGLKEIAKPAVDDDGMLVRVHAASVNPYDWHFLTGLPYLARAQFGLLKPKVTGLGADLAGTVEAVGRDIAQFHPGDEVYGEVDGEVRGHPILDLGSCAEYVCVSEDSVAQKPANLTFEQAAAVPMAGMTALQALRDWGGIRPGQAVLINGASGGVGTFAVQVAKSFDAEVTGVCSTRNVDLVQSIGADEVIDYTREDFAGLGRRYDLLLDLVGNRSLSECRRALNPDGVYVASFGQPDHRWIGPMAYLLRMRVLSMFVGQKLAQGRTIRTQQDLQTLKELIEAGTVTPVIDRTYPLDETPDAMRYLDEGHARGKVVVAV
jgi:NADPH:quinone reductase-like Zn-dependent oxidoreductase